MFKAGYGRREMNRKSALKERCHNCDHYQVAMDKTIYPAPGIRGVWVEGCVERKIRFGNFSEVAAGEGKFPEVCENSLRKVLISAK